MAACRHAGISSARRTMKRSPPLVGTQFDVVKDPSAGSIGAQFTYTEHQVDDEIFSDTIHEPIQEVATAVVSLAAAPSNHPGKCLGIAQTGPAAAPSRAQAVASRVAISAIFGAGGREGIGLGLRVPGPVGGMKSKVETTPSWIGESPILGSAYALAERAHRGHRRPSDGRPFLDHVTEVAALLHDAGLSDELVAVGLLHDSVERGTLSSAELRSEMGEAIATLVLVADRGRVDRVLRRAQGGTAPPGQRSRRARRDRLRRRQALGHRQPSPRDRAVRPVDRISTRLDRREHARPLPRVRGARRSGQSRVGAPP